MVKADGADVRMMEELGPEGKHQGRKIAQRAGRDLDIGHLESLVHYPGLTPAGDVIPNFSTHLSSRIGSGHLRGQARFLLLWVKGEKPLPFGGKYDTVRQ